MKSRTPAPARGTAQTASGRRLSRYATAGPGADRRGRLCDAERAAERRPWLDEARRRPAGRHEPLVLEHTEVAEEHERRQRHSEHGGGDPERARRPSHLRSEQERARAEDAPELEPARQADEHACTHHPAVACVEAGDDPEERDYQLGRMPVEPGRLRQADCQDRDARSRKHRFGCAVLPRTRRRSTRRHAATAPTSITRARTSFRGSPVASASLESAPSRAICCGPAWSLASAKS